MQIRGLALVVALGACSAIGGNNSALSKALTGDDALQGFWQSDAYGEVIEVNGNALNVYEVTSQTCLKSSVGKEQLMEYFTAYEVSETDQLLELFDPVEPYRYKFRKITDLPQSCSAPVKNTIEDNFNVFTSSFGDYYPFFELYGVNWEDEVATARSALSPDMTELEFFRLTRKMIGGLKDAHINYVAKIDGEREIWDGDLGKTEDALFRRAVAAGLNPFKERNKYRAKYWYEDLQKTLHDGEGVIAGDNSLQYGIISEDIGVISVLTMGGYIEKPEETELGVLHSVLDDALALFEARDVKAVIVNVAMNYGGYDYVGRELASRFAENEVQAYSKVSANDPTAEPFSYSIRPYDGARFTGPVYLLTSDVSVSAAEITTMSFRALPNVTHIGETTRGALSDVFSRTLPNGWEFTLSTEIYRDHEGKLWEGKGIPPETEIPIFNIDDPQKGFLEAMETLIALIDEADEDQ